MPSSFQDGLWTACRVQMEAKPSHSHHPQDTRMNRMVSWGLEHPDKDVGLKLSEYLPSCWLLGMFECP